MEAILLINAACKLGEGPMWHSERNSIWWVDIDDRKIFEFNIQSHNLSTWEVKPRISLILLVANNCDLLVAAEDGIALFNINKGTLDYLQYLEKDLKQNRSNDGNCDCLGRLWIGTMHEECLPESGSLYYVNENLKIERKIEKTSISNGLAWNIDCTVLYHIDSATYKVKSYVYDLKTGNIKSEKVIIEIPKGLGMPDGMAVDAEGMLWIAQWGGFSICRWDPITGKMLEKINVPVPNVTSCVFGGENFEYLFITTARQSLNDAELKQYPLSGGVFVAKPKIKGFCKAKFRLSDSVVNISAV